MKTPQLVLPYLSVNNAWFFYVINPCALVKQAVLHCGYFFLMFICLLVGFNIPNGRFPPKRRRPWHFHQSSVIYTKNMIMNKECCEWWILLGFFFAECEFWHIKSNGVAFFVLFFLWMKIYELQQWLVLSYTITLKAD